MWALVESGSITKLINNPRAMVIGDTRHSRKIFSLWSVSEKEAKGIYEVVFNNTNKKDEEYYINTNQSFAFADGVVTASYGDATAKAHADTTWSQDQIDAGEAPAGADTDTVAVEGLKTIRIRTVKSQAANILAETDWYIVRKADADTDVPSAITTFRAAVRTKGAAMETLITNASNTPAIETLYTYTEQVDDDKVISAITKANPAVVTANSHGYSNGDRIIISEVEGMTEVNGETFTVSEKTTNTFELQGINSTGYTTYNSAGVSNKFNGTFARPLGEFPVLGS